MEKFLKLIDNKNTDNEFELLKKIHKQCMTKTIINNLGEYNDEFQFKRLKTHWEKNSKNLKFIQYNNKIIGTINFYEKEFEEKNTVNESVKNKALFIEQFYILPEYQNKGLGTKILDKVMNKQSEVRLSVLKKDKKRIDFYKKRHFYKDKSDEYQIYLKYNLIIPKLENTNFKEIIKINPTYKDFFIYYRYIEKLFEKNQINKKHWFEIDTIKDYILKIISKNVKQLSNIKIEDFKLKDILKLQKNTLTDKIKNLFNDKNEKLKNDIKKLKKMEYKLKNQIDPDIQYQGKKYNMNDVHYYLINAEVTLYLNKLIVNEQEPAQLSNITYY